MVWFNHVALGSSRKQALAVPSGLPACPAPQLDCPPVSDLQETTQVKCFVSSNSGCKYCSRMGVCFAHLNHRPPFSTCWQHPHSFLHTDPCLLRPAIGCILHTSPPTLGFRVLGHGCLSGLGTDQDPVLKSPGVFWPQRWRETIYPFFKWPERVKQGSPVLVQHPGPRGNQIRCGPTAAGRILI